MTCTVNRILIFLALMFFTGISMKAQEAKKKKLFFAADLRLRAEPDWNSRKSDGTYRDDRFRFRFRVRAGLQYKPYDWVSLGIRFRTGYPEKQQDPHLTIGDGYHEFDSVPIGFDKLYFRVHKNWLDAWLGRNTFTFVKLNELFWSDNVSLDGIYISASFETSANWIDGVTYAGGLFTMLNSFDTFSDDSFIGILQISTAHIDNRLKVFPTFYHFNQMPDIPDGNENYRFEYSIFQIGAEALISEHPKITLGADLYQNIQNYDDNENIPEALKNQKKGFVGSVVLGDLDKKGSFCLGAYYTYLERYAAVDFIAQNDWVRWDYSGQGSRDGRLTNLKGLELMTGYRISKMLQLKMRYFVVEQLVPYGDYLENGNRIRLDVDFRF
jgi:hypothetical protein